MQRNSRDETMKILIFGGTRFVGRHLTTAALDAGHQVTLFNRGQSNRGLFPQAEHLVGDRDGGLDPLRGRGWDAVIDVSGYLPRLVRAGVDLLKEQVDYYLFVSTMSVYADWTQPIIESSPLIELDDPTIEEVTGETYGGLKVLCERAVQDAFGDHSCIVRPTYVIGPHDHTDRFPYWIWRAAKGGEMLAPGGPQEPVPYIDGRDMGAWMVQLTERRTLGVFNALSARPFGFGELFDEVSRQTGSQPQPVWVDAAFAAANDLLGGKLPLWSPEGELIATGDSTNAAAAKAGLQPRPLADTVTATLAWVREREAQGHQWLRGLSAEEETRLLAAWKAR